MVREFEDKNEWALILGASSGLGLATAKKLAKEGLNLCLVYRALKSDVAAIESEFEHHFGEEIVVNMKDIGQ